MNEEISLDAVRDQIATGRAVARIVEPGDAGRGVGTVNGDVARMRIVDASDPNRPKGPGYLALPRLEYLRVLEAVDPDRAAAARLRARNPFMARMRARRDRRKREAAA